MEELTLIINKPDEGRFLKRIDWNRKEIMDTVAYITKQYEGLAYTDEQISEAKKDRAALNALKKAISERRIEVKKALMAPYDVFEAEVKEAVALIEKPIELIDSQIKAYEEKVKEDKRNGLAEFFEENAGELKGTVTFDMIFDPRWLNKSVSVKSCRENIMSIIRKTETDTSAIETLVEEKYRAYAKDYYFRNSLDMTATLREVKRMRTIDRKAEEERRAREEEEERKREQAEAEAAAKEKQRQKSGKTAANHHETIENHQETETDAAETETIQQPENPFTVGNTEKVYRARFTVIDTKDKIMSIKDFMLRNNIQFVKG